MKQFLLLLVACAMTMSVMGQVSDTKQQQNTTAAQSAVKDCQKGVSVDVDPVSGNMTFTVDGVSFTMVAVQGGTFTMGATAEQDKDAEDYEQPTHQVTLSNYYIGETEVTETLWRAVTKNVSHNKDYVYNNCHGDYYPKDGIPWSDCQFFVQRLSELTGKKFRLPTEAEWEYAARGGNKSKGYKYAGSDNIREVAWYSFNSIEKAHPVKTLKPNELGLYDMSGNEWEWCQDKYYEYTDAPQTNPVNDTDYNGTGYCVIRGGRYTSKSMDCRTTARFIGESKSLDEISRPARPMTAGLRLVLSE